MIPILYEKDETEFNSNGLARLRDAISVVVTEERNGVFECDFEYPITGANYELIQVGRIIGVTHDETGDIQPFDVVSYDKPIDGVVSFHAVHISYRQSYLTVTGSNINSITDAFNLLKTSTPANPFTYITDISSSAYLAAANGIPHTVREMLGGIEGSILDAYGGEYEFNRWTVNLWSARGQARDFVIRYGVNMVNCDEELDSSGTYSACIPYWTNNETTIVGDKQTATGTTLSGREQCVPLDVSDKFEGQPTKAEVNTMGQTVLNEKNPTAPAQSITVEFARLQDVGEYIELKNLFACRLCDTIKVVFPGYNSSGNYKIVKTVWNVLASKYDEMELGQLSTTLSEALGISSSSNGSGGGGGGGSDTTYALSKTGSTIKLTGSDGTETSVTDSNTTYTMSISGHTITLTPSTGAADTVTVPDNNTTYTLSISGNDITLTPSSGAAQTVTVPDNDTTYSLSIAGNVLTLTPSSGAADSVTIPDNNTTYSISIVDHTITLTPSDGAAQTVTVPDDNTTYSISGSGNTVTLTGSDGSTSSATVSGGGGGTSDYDDLTDKPSINSVTLSGNKTTSDLSIHEIPTGGSSGQVLAKSSETDYDVGWITPSGGGSGTPIPTANTVAEFDSTAHMNSTDMTSAEVDSFVAGLNASGINAVDYIVEQGTESGWNYRKWNSGIVEAWAYSLSLGSQSSSSWVSPVRYKDLTITIPSGIFTNTPTVTATSATNQWWVALANGTSTTSISTRFATLSSSSSTITVNIYARG